MELGVCKGEGLGKERGYAYERGVGEGQGMYHSGRLVQTVLTTMKSSAGMVSAAGTQSGMCKM